MAGTVTQPNNAAIDFRGEGDREMLPKPPKTEGLPKVVKPKKARLPSQAKKMAKRGLISERQMAKIKGSGL